MWNSKIVSYAVVWKIKKIPTFHYENDLLRHCPHGVCEGTCIGPAIRSLEVPNLHRLLVQRDCNPLGVEQRGTIFGPHHIWFRGALGLTEEVDRGPQKLMKLGWRARSYVGFCCKFKHKLHVYCKHFILKLSISFRCFRQNSFLKYMLI